MPVKIDMSIVEWDAISQMAKDYEILYDALEEISDMVLDPFRMKFAADNALDKVTIKP